MIAWSTLGKLAWEAMQPPDPASLVERGKRVLDAYEEAGHAAELFNAVCRLSEEENGETSC